MPTWLVHLPQLPTEINRDNPQQIKLDRRTVFPKEFKTFQVSGGVGTYFRFIYCEQMFSKRTAADPLGWTVQLCSFRCLPVNIYFTGLTRLSAPPLSESIELSSF